MQTPAWLDAKIDHTMSLRMSFSFIAGMSMVLALLFWLPDFTGNGELSPRSMVLLWCIVAPFLVKSLPTRWVRIFAAGPIIWFVFGFNFCSGVILPIHSEEVAKDGTRIIRFGNLRVHNINF
jgi:hypothetical protein